MTDWRKDSFPPPQARLPLDAEEWSWREDRASGERASDRDSQPVRGRRGPRAKLDTGDSRRPLRTGGTNARPVPRMPKSRPESQVRSKGITLAGTMLILGLTVLAFAGGRLFGRVEEPSTETVAEPPAQTVPAPELAAAPPELEPEEETPVALPAAFERAPVVGS
jgi:hypothetical protein